MDLLKNDIRTVAPPGQATEATYSFNIARGFEDSMLESKFVQGSPVGQSTGVQINQGFSAAAIFSAAQSGGIPLVVLNPSDPTAVQCLTSPPTRRALITTASEGGEVVIVPRQSVTVDGTAEVGWYEMDSTGYTVGVLEDGSHGEFEYESLQSLTEEANLPVAETFKYIAGVMVTAGIGGVILALDSSSYEAFLGVLGRPALNAILKGNLAFFEQTVELASADPAFQAGVRTGLQYAELEVRVDPPTGNSLFEEPFPLPSDQAVGSLSISRGDEHRSNFGDRRHEELYGFRQTAGLVELVVRGFDHCGDAQRRGRSD